MHARSICRICTSALVALAAGCAVSDEAVYSTDDLPPAPLFEPVEAPAVLREAPILDSRLLPEDDLSRRGYVVRGQEPFDARRASPAAKRGCTIPIRLLR